MKEQLLNYLKAIGMPELLCTRTTEIYNFYKETCPDEITDVFVTDYIKEDGTREYENLWFFSKKYGMEAKQFITTDNFDITPMQNRVFYWTIQKQNYDFKKATEKSRLYLSFKLDTKISGEFKAAKENCDYLKEIFSKYISPNLK